MPGHRVLLAAPLPPVERVCDWAIFLDFDGTLVSIAQKPGDVEVGAPLRHLLESLADAAGGAVALVSGRRIDDVDRLFAPLTLPIAGVHGAERRDAKGVMHSLPPAAALAAMLPTLIEFAGRHGGVLVEDKGASVAMHYRARPEAEPALRTLLATLIRGRSDMEVIEGKMVLEVRGRGVNKGIAVRAFMNEPPFAGRLPVFLGDDVTDEDAFMVVNALGGIAIRVGAHRSTAARYGLPDVVAVLEWLHQVSDAMAGRGSSS